MQEPAETRAEIRLALAISPTASDLNVGSEVGWGAYQTDLDRVVSRGPRALDWARLQPSGVLWYNNETRK